MQIVKDEEEQEVAQVPGPTFDPTKKYRWEPTTEFKLDGGEFAILLNALRAYLSTEEAQLALLVDQASKALEAQLGAAVEDGRAVEIV